MKHNENVAMLETVSKALGELCDEVVFVGGATVGLYIDDVASPPPRPSDDIDCVVEITTQKEYREFEKKLRARGFRDPVHDDSPPICRKYCGDIKVDIMPMDESVLGFSNKWYREAIKHKKRIGLPSGGEIWVLSVTYFLVTKLAAFANRGESDIRLSQDIEDICSLFEGCTHLKDEVLSAPQTAKSFVREELSRILGNERLFEEAAHAFARGYGDPNAQARRIVRAATELMSGL